MNAGATNEKDTIRHRVDLNNLLRGFWRRTDRLDCPEFFVASVPNGRSG